MRLHVVYDLYERYFVYTSNTTQVYCIDLLVTWLICTKQQYTHLRNRGLFCEYTCISLFRIVAAQLPTAVIAVVTK